MSARVFAVFGGAIAAGALWFTARGTGAFDDAAGDSAGADGGDVEDAGPGVLEQMTNTVTNAVTSPTSASDAALNMLAGIEGFSATPYPDHKGYSIGYGHLIRSGENLSFITRPDAWTLMRSDVAWAERAVSAAVSAPLTQPQFDGLCSLCFNIGSSAFKRSTLVRLLNAGDYPGAADQFARWNKSRNGAGDLVVDSGLVTRRNTEAMLFSGGSYV